METKTRLKPQTQCKLVTELLAQPQDLGAHEPSGVVLVGGPLKGQKRRQTGETRRVFHGEVYMLTKLTVNVKKDKAVQFDVLAYDGPEWA